MKSQPRNRIAVNAKKVWRINASLYISVIAGVLTYFWNTWSIPDSFIYIAWVINIACLIFFIWLLPARDGEGGVMKCLSKKYTYKVEFLLLSRQLYR
nr:hypothetical protein [Terribacillus saccharophilus]